MIQRKENLGLELPGREGGREGGKEGGREGLDIP